MLPRQRIGLVVSRSWIIGLVGWLMLSGCDDSTPQQQQAPATTVPQGLLDLSAKNARDRDQITPRAKALEAMAALTQDSGLSFHRLQHQGTDVAALVEIDLAKLTPAIVAQPTGVRPIDAIQQANVRLVIGSSFVSQVRRMQPIGVLKVNDELLQDVEVHGYTRILGIHNISDNLSENVSRVDTNSNPGFQQRFGVVHRSEWPLEHFHSALQAGPGIIEEGQLDISERDLQRQKYFRSFVAECGERSVVGATLVPMHLHTLGSELVKFFAAKQLGCNEVVNLAGDRESVLLLRKGNSAVYLGDPNQSKAGLISFSEVHSAEG